MCLLDRRYRHVEMTGRRWGSNRMRPAAFGSLICVYEGRIEATDAGRDDFSLGLDKPPMLPAVGNAQSKLWQWLVTIGRRVCRAGVRRSSIKTIGLVSVSATACTSATSAATVMGGSGGRSRRYGWRCNRITRYLALQPPGHPPVISRCHRTRFSSNPVVIEPGSDHQNSRSRTLIAQYHAHQSAAVSSV